MSDSWKKIFKGNLEGRDIEIEEYNEGGYKVKTTQNEDDEGSVSVDKSSTTIIPPTEAGREITIEGETKEDLIKDMVSEGFTEDGVKNIIDDL